MRPSDPQARLTLRLAVPPYGHWMPLPALREPQRRLPRGTVLAVDLLSSAEERLLERGAIAALRARHPTAPVVLRIPEVTPETVRLAHRAGRMGVRAVVGAGEPVAEVLRPILTDPESLAAELAEWLAVRGRPLPPAVAAQVRAIVERAPDFPLLGPLLDDLGHSERTVRHRFRREGVPGPRAWHRGARALHAALRLQAVPGASLLEVAVELGYADTSGISRQVSRAFGVTPAAIRGTLGWEWLADRWLTRNERGTEEER